jgi:hypothetical protein
MRACLKRKPNTAAEGLNAGEELLLCCARSRVDIKTAERIRSLLRQDIDWPYLLRIAGQHRVVPLLYQSLYMTCSEAVPEAVLAQLREHFHATVVRNYALTAELLKLLDLFETHHIPAIPLKGPALAVSVYGDVSLREFTDLDLLVRKQDVPAAEDLIASQGYEPKQRMTRTQQAASLQVKCSRGFVRNDGKVRVELHWGLLEWQFASSAFAFDSLWQRTGQVSLVGTTVRSFPPEDLLLFLCVHGAKHIWDSLGWICDVAELVRLHQKLDWERTMAQASNGGGERRLLLGLCLARDLLGTPLPERVQQRVEADSQLQALARRVRARLFCSRQDSSPDRLFFDLMAMERWRDRVKTYSLRYVLLLVWVNQALDPPGDRLRPLYRLLERVPAKQVWTWPMPAFALLSWLCHPLRPIRHIMHAAACWGRGVPAFLKQAIER